MDEIREMIKMMEQSSLEELELEQEGVRLSLRKSLPVSGLQEVEVVRKPRTDAVIPNEMEHRHNVQDSEQEADENVHKITSPMVGTFYRAPSPDADPFVDPGERVTTKTVVCIVEAMKLMNEIEADVEGEIIEVLAENGQLVEYGQPLFLVKK